MAKITGFGTALQVDISAVFTTVAQLTSITLPEAQVETYESSTLDGSVGISHDPTGRVEGGSCGFEGFLDPAGTTHQALTDLITTPAKEDFKIVFTDSANTEWPFTGAGVSFGGNVSLNEGVRFTGSIKLDGIVTYPT